MRRAAPPAFLALMLLVCCALAGTESPREFRVFESGAVRTLRLVSNDRVVDAERSSAQMVARPEVIVAVERKAMVPDLAERYDARGWGSGAAGGCYILRFDSPASALRAAEQMLRDGVEASAVLLRRRHSRFTPKDPYLPSQWHLRNTGSQGASKGIDLRVTEAWKQATGRGVNIAIVDDGLEVRHPDLRENCFALDVSANTSLHYDFIGGDTNPSPSLYNPHGTAVAGLVAARSNFLGGVGVAPEAKLAGLRLTADLASDQQEAAAFAWRNTQLHIYNNSWGPEDTGSVVEGPGAQARLNLQKAALSGRGGRGNIIVWAAGNGSDADDSNYDGYANSIYTIAVGAASDRGVLSSQAEAGCNIVVVAPSSSQGRQGLITTDLSGTRGYNVIGANDGEVIPAQNVASTDYTNDFGMTSGAAPQVAGVIALMLQVNPRLGWRDVQEILITTARKIDVRSSGWKRNGAGLQFNDWYGAGLVDASAAVAKARGWKNLAGVREVRLRRIVNGRVPDGQQRGLSVKFDMSALQNLRIEHVQLAVTVEHPWRGDLRYELKSPSGMSSVVAAREFDDGTTLANWIFMSVQHWGESSRGVWTLDVSDRTSGDAGTLKSAELIIRGTPILTTARR